MDARTYRCNLRTGRYAARQRCPLIRPAYVHGKAHEPYSNPTPWRTCVRGLRAAADAAGRAGVAVGRASHCGTSIAPQLCHASTEVPCTSRETGLMTDLVMVCKLDCGA